MKKRYEEKGRLVNWGLKRNKEIEKYDVVNFGGVWREGSWNGCRQSKW